MITLIAPCQIGLVGGPPHLEAVEPCLLGAHNKGIVTPRRIATIANPGNKLPWGTMHPVRQRRQSGADKDDQDDEQDSAHNQLFKR